MVVNQHILVPTSRQTISSTMIIVMRKAERRSATAILISRRLIRPKVHMLLCLQTTTSSTSAVMQVRSHHRVHIPNVQLVYGSNHLALITAEWYGSLVVMIMVWRCASTVTILLLVSRAVHREAPSHFQTSLPLQTG